MELACNSVDVLSVNVKSKVMINGMDTLVDLFLNKYLFVEFSWENFEFSNAIGFFFKIV